MWPKAATRFGKNLPKWQKFAKVAKNCQFGKKSPKWLKVLKLGSMGFQGVPDGSRSETAWARTTRGTYARAPYAFAALGQGPKGPELVTKKDTFVSFRFFFNEGFKKCDSFFLS